MSVFRRYGVKDSQTTTSVRATMPLQLALIQKSHRACNKSDIDSFHILQKKVGQHK